MYYITAQSSVNNNKNQIIPQNAHKGIKALRQGEMPSDILHTKWAVSDDEATIYRNMKNNRSFKIPILFHQERKNLECEV